MREFRIYRVMFAQSEIIRALKAAYPESLSVQAIPGNKSSTVMMKVESPLSLTFTWEAEIKE